MLSLDCPKRQRILRGCDFCILQLPCMCSISTDTQYLPPRLEKCRNESDEVTILYPVNLALIQEFFSPSSHATLFGDNTFEEFIELKTREFKIFNHSINSYLANHNQYHLSLKRMAKLAKNDSVVFQSLAESMLAGDVTLPLLAWPDTSGIIAVSAMAAAAVTILCSIYLFCKVRSFLTALVVVHQAKPAYWLVIPNPKLSFIYSKSTDVTTPTPMIENIYNYMSSPLVYIILSVLATLFIVALVHILIRKAKRSHRTTLHIELTNGPDCILVPITTLPLCPQYWEIEPPYDVVSVSVTSAWLFHMYLLIDCSDFTITNVHTKRSVFVPPVSLLQAFAIQRMIKKTYTAYFILSHNGYFKML